MILEMMNWIKAYYGDCFILLLAMISYFYLFFRYKVSRRQIIYPVLLIIFLLLNPILYRYIYRANRYWRFFWMVPNGMIIALAVGKMIENARSRLLKSVVGSAFVGLVVLCGTNVYVNGGFTKVQNWSKVSRQTQEVCDYILTIDDHPRCIMPDSIFTETRQYNGNIEQYYGRDAHGYIYAADEIRTSVYQSLASMEPDYEFVLSEANKAKIDFIVVENNKPIDTECLTKYDFEYVGAVDIFFIYEKR